MLKIYVSTQKKKHGYCGNVNSDFNYIVSFCISFQEEKQGFGGSVNITSISASSLFCNICISMHNKKRECV